MKKVFIIPMIIALLVAMGLAGCAEEEAPEAAFSASPPSGDAPLTVQFTDQSTGEVDSWDWDFGDGSTSTQQSPSHTYDTAGTYTVSLEVTGPDGSDTETKTDYITVTTAAAPAADFSASPPSGDAPLTVQFSDDSTGGITAWAWDFGDNTTSTTQNPSHTYDTAGIYTVSLEVTGPGGSDSVTKTDYISVTAPAAAAYWIYDVHYERTLPDVYSNDTMRKVTLVESEVTPTHLGSSTVAIPEVTCNHLFLDYQFGNTTPLRWNPDSPAPVEQYSMDRFISTADGTQVYEYVTGLALGAPLEVELVYDSYTLLSGNNIGLPYDVGSSWSYNVTTEPFVGGGTFGAKTKNLTATVTAENVEVTVDAGTFNDCVEIEIHDAADQLLKTLWWSLTVQGLVKLEDVGSYVGLTLQGETLDGMETWELTDYTLI